MVHVLLKPGLENFDHYCTTVWEECNCAVVWAFFGIAFLWDWNENWSFPVLWPLLSFPNLLAYWCSTFTVSSFRIWNGSTGILSPLLALFIGMLLKAHLTSHSRMSGSRWVITPSWLSGSWSVRGRSTLRDPICCFLPLCAVSQGLSVPYQFLENRNKQSCMQFSGLTWWERAPAWIPFSDSFQWLPSVTF